MDFTASIVDNIKIAENSFLLTVGGVPGRVFEEFAPGRFAHLRMPDSPDLTLRRPLAIFDVRREMGEMDFVYRVVGEGTRRLANASAGGDIGLLAPLGNGFCVPQGAKTGAVVGGGTGCAALLSVASGFDGVSWRAYLGFASDKCAYGIERFEAAFERVDVFTDDGSLGSHGNPVSALCSSDLPDVVLACGPDAMVRALQAALPDSVAAFVSVEARMGCGVGACLVCACKTLGPDGIRHKRVCADGPVFGLWEVALGG